MIWWLLPIFRLLYNEPAITGDPGATGDSVIFCDEPGITGDP